MPILLLCSKYADTGNVAVAILIGTSLTTTTVYAGNEHGKNGPFSEDTYDYCRAEKGGDDAYYKGFIDGCVCL